jgi:hypothetical protein
MPLSHLPAFLTTAFLGLARWLHKNSAARLPLLLYGILFAKGRRTVTSWFRAAGITTEWRKAYVTVCATGREAQHMAHTVVSVVRPLLKGERLRVAIDDSPTKRYGPTVEGAGIHHNPTPGPAGAKHLYGHNWVTLAAIADHKDWGIVALPLQAQLYIREANLPDVPEERRPEFRTKLEMAADQLDWLKPSVELRFKRLEAVVDGGYAKRAFLRRAKNGGWVVFSRLRKDAALFSVPKPKAKGQRGPQATYGKDRLSLAKRAGQPGGWQQVTCVQYGEEVTKTIKTFLATWRPAGGVIRVVLVKEDDGWVAFFCTDPDVSAEEVLEAMADRGAIEGTFKDVKEIWGAGEQQVRNLDSNVGCFNLNLWMYSLVEAWAWEMDEADLVDRSDSPWDNQPRRPSHADKRNALQRQILQTQIDEVLAANPNNQGIRDLAQRLLDLAA